MSDTDVDVDVDETTDEGTKPEGDGPKALRALVKKLEKQLEAEKQSNAKNGARLREIDLAEALDKHGASRRLAKYAARDIEDDINEDNVLTWLKENGEDFGWSADDADSTEDDVEVVDRRRISAATTRAPQGRPDSSAELLHALRTMDAKTLIEKGFIDAE